MPESFTDSVTVYPQDVPNLEYLAGINQRLVEERAAGLPRIEKTAIASFALADIIKKRIEPVPDGEVNGVELELDEDMLSVLSISRNLGDVSPGSTE